MDSIANPWAEAPERVLAVLQVDAGRGLDPAEAIQRRLDQGDNLLRPAARISRAALIARQLRSPVVLVLALALVLSALLGEAVDAGAIGVILILNSVIGYVQELRAEGAVEALRRMAAPRSRVLRGAQVIDCPAAELTLGDILVLEAGDYVAADARLLTASEFAADESTLTGESEPSGKAIAAVPASALVADRSNMIFAGTLVTRGSARAVVTSIGMKTEFGRIADLLEKRERAPTPLQKRLEQVTRRLLIIGGLLIAAMAVMQTLRSEGLLESLMTGISLAVAAIPEGLPTVVTVALALAMRRMASRNAIIRHLPAVETLGSTEVICTDKTGTLTTGKMRVREIIDARGVIQPASAGAADPAVRALARSAALCSNASLTTGDPTEVALMVLADECAIDLSPLSTDAPRISEWPFDSTRKRMSVAVREQGRMVLYVKGASESLLELCSLPEESRKRIEASIQELLQRGRRVLAVAERRSGELSGNATDVERDLTLMGLVAIADPPRPEAASAIQRCQQAGIRVVMITGDHPVTARAIAGELGLLTASSRQVITGYEVQSLPDQDLQQRMRQVAVCARVSPEDKVRIVRALQQDGKVVAMTGDGVNDAPALKEAAIGIAMGRGGTEVARQASSMVLVDDHFETIVSAVEEGRAVYGNIRRTIAYLLSGNLAEIAIMFGAFMLGWPLPFLPVHLLWINLVTDGLPALALAAEPVPDGLLRETDRPSRATFFSRDLNLEMMGVAAMSTTIVLGVYGYSLASADPLTARSRAFAVLVFEELLRSFSSRSSTRTAFELGFLSNRSLVAAVLVPIGFQILIHGQERLQRIFHVRFLSGEELATLLVVGVIPALVLESRKVLS
jgi:Ca2+-transporting ATPase